MDSAPLNLERRGLTSLRDLYDVPDEIVYLNTANLGPRLRSVAAAGHAAIERWSKPWSITPANWFGETARVRSLAAEVLGIDDDGVALVPSVSYGMAVAARNLRVSAGQVVVVLEGEFPSNYYVWQRVCDERGAELRVVRQPSDGDWESAICAAIDARTAVVSVPVCHWTDGATIGLARVAASARRAAAALVIDASQWIGAAPLDIAELDPDFLVTVGYKWLLGPYGSSFLYVAPRHRAGVPIEEPWPARAGSENLARLTDYRDEYRAGARRFDAGEHQNFILLPIAIAALEQVVAWTPAVIAARLAVVTTELANAAEQLGFVVTLAARRAPHFFGVEAGETGAAALTETLRVAGVHVSTRGAFVRVAPHLHTTPNDVARFADVLRRTR